jgi:dihydroorotase-like cyclic amidohydrolase
LETTFALLYSELVLKNELTLPRLVEVLSSKPARLLDIQDKAGTLQPGYPADFVLIDPAITATVNPVKLLSMSRNTPLTGINLTGWPVATYVRGQRVFREGEQA